MLKIASLATASLLCGVCTVSTWQTGQGNFKCEQTCRAHTQYADRCVKFSKDESWCRNTLEAMDPNFKGFPAGRLRLQCGCWGPAPGPYELRDPVCASGYSIAQPCSQMCYGGGVSYRFVCTKAKGGSDDSDDIDNPDDFDEDPESVEVL